MAKRKTLADRVAAAVPEAARPRSIPWHARLSPEQREQLGIIRTQFQAGHYGASAMAVARAISSVAKQDGWATPTTKEIAAWLRKSD